jgi:hypothetical protein
MAAMLRAFVVCALLLGPAIASGERLIYGPGDIAPSMAFVGEPRPDGLVMARQVIPGSTVPSISNDRIAAVAQSRLVFMNKGGVTLNPGSNDARINRSTVVNATTSLAGWNPNATTWSETMSCMRGLFSRWDIAFVDTDPGNVPHIEAVFGGTPEQVGLDPGVAGVSPFTTDCSIIENSIVFTFTQGFSFSSREACEIMAQEIAHSYGLDHELLAADPMTYLPYTGNRSFQDVAAQCGESEPRTCGIAGNVCRATQNSVQLLRDRLGSADSIMPTIPAMSPIDNATVPPGFQVKLTAADNTVVVGATLKIDGSNALTIDGPGPFVFPTDAALPEGVHEVAVDVSDGKNIRTETRTVTVKIGAPPPDQSSPGTDADDPFGTVSGGCSSGRASGTGALLAFGMLIASRRRRRRCRPPSL